MTNNNIKFSYEEVKEKIKEKIVSGEYKINYPIPSERNLCEIFNVSRTTIRKAIDGLVEDDFLIKSPGKGTFVNDLLNGDSDRKENHLNESMKNFNESSFTNSNTGNIVFLRCTHHNLEESNSSVKEDIFYPQVVAGIDSFVNQKGYHCIFKYVYEQTLTVQEIDNITNKAEGIICAELHNVSFRDKLLSLDLPVVLVNPSIISDDADTVEIDNVAGAYKATRYLLSLGHKNIAFVGGSCESFSGKYRKQGYIEALAKANIEVESRYITFSDWSIGDGYQAALNFLKLKKPPTAIFAASDLLAIGVINAAKDSGLVVPDDISVIGFDDIELASQIRPALTTLQVRKNEIGKMAANLIFERLSSNRNYPIKVLIPTILQKRNTVKEL